MSSRRAPQLAALLHIAWPIYVAQLAMMASGLVDTVMAGRLSTLDLAAVGIASSIQVTILMSLASVLFALPPIVAHLHGEARPAEIGWQVHQSLWIALAIGVLAVVLLLNPEPFLALSAMEPAVEAKVRAYLVASSWGVPAILGLRVYMGLFIGIGRPRSVMHVNLAALALKVPLNAVLMHGLLGMPALGSTGCAAATAAAYWIVIAAAWAWCLSQPAFAPFALVRRLPRPHWPTLLAFLKLGVPIALTFIADVTAFTFMALFIARLGAQVSAAHQIAANLAVFAFMLPLSLGHAAATLVGQALGAGEPERARQTCLQAMGLGLGISILVSLAYWLGADTIAALYTPDPRGHPLAASLIVLVAAYHLADALQAVAVNALRGYKRTAVPMFIYTACLWGIGLGGGLALGLTDWLGPARGAAGFWIAGAASLGLVAVLVSTYLEWVSRVAPSHARSGRG